MFKKFDWNAMKASVQEKNWWDKAHFTGKLYRIDVYMPAHGTSEIRLVRFCPCTQQLVMKVDITESNLIIPVNMNLWSCFSKQRILKLIALNNNNPEAFLEILYKLYIKAYPVKHPKKLQKELENN